MRVDLFARFDGRRGAAFQDHRIRSRSIAKLVVSIRQAVNIFSPSNAQTRRSPMLTNVRRDRDTIASSKQIAGVCSRPIDTRTNAIDDLAHGFECRTRAHLRETGHGKPREIQTEADRTVAIAACARK